MGIAKHSLLHSITYPDRLDDEEVTRATEADNVNVVGSNWNWFPMYIEWSGTGLADCQQRFASISKNSMKKYRQTRGTSKADVGQNFHGSIFSRQNGVAVTFPANRHVMLAGHRDPSRRVAIGRGSSRAIASTFSCDNFPCDLFSGQLSVFGSQEIDAIIFFNRRSPFFFGRP